MGFNACPGSAAVDAKIKDFCAIREQALNVAYMPPAAGRQLGIWGKTSP